jgi:hypothetical protein
MAAISAILFSSDHFDQKEFEKGILIYGPFTERIVLKNNYFNKGVDLWQKVYLYKSLFLIY